MLLTPRSLLSVSILTASGVLLPGAASAASAARPAAATFGFVEVAAPPAIAGTSG